jgi:hypothetical protein
MELADCTRERLLLADTVEKLENRAAPKISRRSIVRSLYRCAALQDQYEGPWSLLCKSMWSPTSPHVERTSSPKKFGPSAEKDFF